MSAPTLIRRTEVEAPALEKQKYHLLDVANVSDNLGSFSEPTGLYRSLSLLATSTLTTMCPTARSAKSFGGVTLVDGIRFPVYSGVNCKGVGLDWNAIQDQLAAIDDLKESQGVERQLMQTRFTGAGGGAAATDLTPAGGAVNPYVGLAILEGHARAKYAGNPTMHIPGTIASILFAMGPDLVVEGGKLLSSLGSKIAVGSGYEWPNNGPTGAAPAAGELWMYASGEVTIRRGKRIAVPYQVSMSDNEFYALVERIYVADVDSYVSAVRVKIA